MNSWTCVCVLQTQCVNVQRSAAGQISAFLMPLNRCPLNIPHCRYTEKYLAIHSRNPPHALWRPEGKLGEKLIAIHAVYRARAAPIHRQQWDNATVALRGSMADAGPTRGKKNWLSILIWNWVFAHVCVSVYFSSTYGGVCVCVCANPDLITCAQYLLEQGYPWRSNTSS